MSSRVNIFGLLLLPLILASCGVCKCPPVAQKDSTVVNIVDQVVTRDSVVFVTLPQEQSQSVGPEPSHLETSLAESDAYVDTLGRLHHTLRNKSVALPVHIPITTTAHIESHAQLSTHFVEVEKHLTRWQQFRLKAFWWLILLSIALIAYIFRKPLVAVVKKLI